MVLLGFVYAAQARDMSANALNVARCSEHADLDLASVKHRTCARKLRDRWTV